MSDTQTGNLPVAQDWAQWAQGGYMPPPSAAMDNPRLMSAGPANVTPPQAPPVANLNAVRGAYIPPPNEGSLSGVQTAPTGSDWWRNPVGAAQDLLARQQATTAPMALGGAPPAAAVSAVAPPPPPPPPQTGAEPPIAAPAPPVAPPVAPTPPQVQPTPPVVPQQPVGAPAGAVDQAGAPGTGLNIKRNNPLNIRYVGQQGATDEGGFASFPSVDAGFKAADDLMATYPAKYGTRTLLDLTSKWAPKGDGPNDPVAYAATVSKMTGIPVDQNIDLTDPAVRAKIIPAMARVESGTGGGGSSGIQVASSTPPGGATGVTQGAGPGGSRISQPQDIAELVKSLQGVMPYSTAETQQQPGDKLLALASGLLGSRNFGEGLGKGLSNMTKMSAADIANKRASNTQILQLAQMGLLNNYRNAGLDIKDKNATTAASKPIGTPFKGDDGLMYQRHSDPNNPGQEITTRVPGTTTQQENADNGLKRYDPTAQGAVADAKTAATDSSKTMDALFKSAPADTQALNEIKETRDLIQQHPDLMGPTLKAQAVRSLNRAGLDGDPADQDVLTKAFTDQRNNMLSTLTGGHVGGIRSNAELQNISKSVADIATSPAAAQYIVGLQQAQIEARQAWRTQLQQAKAAGKQLPVGHDYQMSQNAFYNDYLKQNPLPTYSPSGSGQSQQPGSGQPALSSFWK